MKSNESLHEVNQKPTKAALKGLVFSVVGLLLVAWLLNTPPGVLGKADAIGYAVCHRIDLRSFHIGERPLPLCVRCSGMYLGAMLGLAVQVVGGAQRAGSLPKRVWPAIALLAVLFGIDGLNSYLHLFPGAPGAYEPNHILRLFTGAGLGVAISAVLFPAINQTLWVTYDARPGISGLRSFGKLLLLAAGLCGLILTGSPIVLYPLALISSGGVLVLLTLVYMLLWLIPFRVENRWNSWRELALPLAAGFGSALLQIATLDLARYWLTGTWQGFPFG